MDATFTVVDLAGLVALLLIANPRAARKLASEKEAFRDIEAKAMAAHFARLRAGRVETAEPAPCIST
jgi:phosphate:Na+ symporter